MVSAWRAAANRQPCTPAGQSSRDRRAHGCLALRAILRPGPMPGCSCLLRVISFPRPIARGGAATGDIHMSRHGSYLRRLCHLPTGVMPCGGSLGCEPTDPRPPRHIDTPASLFRGRDGPGRCSWAHATGTKNESPPNARQPANGFRDNAAPARCCWVEYAGVRDEISR